MPSLVDSRRAKVDKWPTLRVHRSQIETAEYNPRTIDKHAGKRLGEGLKHFGLADKLTLNRRSTDCGFEEKFVVAPDGSQLFVGTLVGGHQRLDQIDKMEKDLDYTIEVTLVDLDIKMEKELNVLLNNPAIQGQYDADALTALIAQGKENFDFSMAGFEAMDLQAMLDIDLTVLDETRSLFSAEAQPEAAQEALRGTEQLVQEKVEERAKKEAEIAKIKEKKREARQAQRAADDSNFYMTIVFQSNDRMSLFQQAVGADTKYVDGERLITLMGLDDGSA